MPKKRFPDIPEMYFRGSRSSYRQRVRAGSYLDWILPAMLSYPQKYTLDVVPPEKIVWEEVEQAADSRENYEELLQHIDHAKPELLQQYDPSGFPTVTHIRVRPAKKVNIRFRN